MSKDIIYHFSGSGNSLAVARDIAGLLEAECRPMAGRVKSPEGDAALGLVFPLYDFKAPVIVRETLDSLDLKDRYIFAAATCGVSPGPGLEKLASDIESRGGMLSLGISVPMPHNAVGSTLMSPEDDDGFFKDWENRRESVAAMIRRRTVRKPEKELLLRAILKPRLLKTMPAVFHLLGLLVFKGAKSLSFAWRENCTGCGTCRQVCPRNNITIGDGHPIWGDNCLSCFACLHWCPTGSIDFSGRSLHTRRYHHPEVNLSDMLLRD